MSYLHSFLLCILCIVYNTLFCITHTLHHHVHMYTHPYMYHSPLFYKHNNMCRDYAYHAFMYYSSLSYDYSYTTPWYQTLIKHTYTFEDEQCPIKSPIHQEHYTLLRDNAYNILDIFYLTF
jgi:hypothetical protein